VERIHHALYVAVREQEGKVVETKLYSPVVNGWILARGKGRNGRRLASAGIANKGDATIPNINGRRMERRDFSLMGQEARTSPCNGWPSDVALLRNAPQRSNTS
jgi:hypothetical protein